MLGQPIFGDVSDGFLRRLGRSHQRGKLARVEHRHLGAGGHGCAHGGDAVAPAQQLDLPYVLAPSHARDDELLAVGRAQVNLHFALCDDVEVLGRRALADDGGAGREGLPIKLAHGLDELLFRQPREGLGQVFFDDLAVRDDDRARDPLRQVPIVRHHQDRLALVDQAFEHPEDRVGRLRIEVAGRLIGDQDRRVVGQGAGDGHALLLPARERGGEFVGLIDQLDPLQKLQGAGFPLAPRVRVAEIHGQHQVFQHGEGRQQLEELEDDAHPAAAPLRQLVLAQLVHRRALDKHLTARGPVDPGDHVDQRRLAAARLADDGHKLPRADLQIDIFERGEFAGRGAEHFAHLAQLDEMVLALGAARLRPLAGLCSLHSRAPCQ